MSYEGHTQNLCKNGHYWTGGEGYYNEIGSCPDCDEKEPIWTNAVDDTNCDSYGFIEMDQFLISKAEHKTCDMGHAHEVKPEVFRIPTAEETKAARCYRPHYGGTPLVPINS
jgi:hypothetical protein